MEFLGLEIKKKEDKPKATPTQLIAEEFVKRALSVINAQIPKEVERCGFSVVKLRAGEIRLNRIEQRQQTQGGEAVVIENYLVGNIVIMSVRWSANGFTIEVNSEAVINSLKRQALGLKPSRFGRDVPVIDLTTKMSERDILIEQRTNEILENHNKKLLQNGKEAKN
ncbi:hypothetical protein [Flavobacterium phage FPSV-S1]|nr:hypothetical protein [Flavobacterium phage FPSV-S1]QCW20643.1 hypothetical protein [Flavobacterium phage FPSV-S27]